MSSSEAGHDAPRATDDDRDIVLGGSLVDRTRRVPGRWQAGLFDLLVGAYVVGAVLAALVSLDLIRSRLPLGVGLLVLWSTMVLVEWLAGGSPGKLVAGLEVVQDDGSALGLRAAVLRRPWGLPLLLVPIGLDTLRTVVTIAAVIGLVAVAAATLRAVDGRGWQDRLAGTRVRPSERSGRVRTITILAIVVVVLVAAVVRSVGRGDVLV